MSSSQQLYAHSQALRGAAASLETFARRTARDHARVRLGAQGNAVQAAFDTLGASLEGLRTPQEAMARAADIIELYLPLVRWAESLADSPLAELAALSQPGLEQAIDFMCSQHLLAACTPAMPPPLRRFEDFSTLSLAATHATNVIMAPPHMRELLLTQPDAILLEASAQGAVVMVYPGGAAELDAMAQHGTHPAAITTVVPGVGSSQPQSWPTQLERATALSRASGQPIIAWMGYGAPGSIGHGASGSAARRGAQELATFQKAVRERWPGARTVVVGYSYGSVVTGMAAKDLHADDLVFVGSPGTTLHSATEVSSRVWATTNQEDPIQILGDGRTGAYGPDPASPEFGARPLGAAAGTHGPLSAAQSPGDHVSYWSNQGFYEDLARVINPAPGAASTSPRR